jgi:two-component system, NarL family, sensor kinase
MGAKATYEELEARLGEAEKMIKALRIEQVDAIIGDKNIYLVRLKQMEEALRKSREELEIRVQERTEQLSKEVNERRTLSKRLVKTIERDRRDMAMYLHDEIGQMLTTLKMELERAGNGTGEATGPCNEKLKTASARTLEIMKKVKDVSRNLRPDLLDTLGLASAIRSLVASLKDKSNLRINVHFGELDRAMDTDKSIALYRIAQEALTNVVKHAKATEVFLTVIRKNRSFQLSVEDNGNGFNYAAFEENITDKGPLGIRIMRERAVLVGGDLTVESKIGKGTHVMAEIPV